jgi:lipid II:glycine glycyltransferase (peptidoglycan interpeptide bridge formation enzyme)
MPGVATICGGTPSISFYRHQLDLVADTDRLFGRLEGSVRRAIRKAEKSGLTLEVSSTLAAVRDYYSLHCQTRRRHGLPPQPFRFFRNIHDRILARDLGAVILARHQGRAAAAAIFFQRGTEAIYKFGASDAAFQDVRANNLVMWEAIKWCAQKGAMGLDFGRTSLSNEGLRRYKLGWGTQESRMDYFRYDLRKNQVIPGRDDTLGWHTRVFRALPVSVARIIGAALYKHTA